MISADVVGRRVAQHRAAIEAAREAGVPHVVYTSYLNPVEENPAVITSDHWETEKALRESGLVWTALRDAFYAEYQVPTGARAIATSRLVHNNGDRKTAYVSREDCAAAAAAVLTTEGHEGRAYDITGPEPLSQGDMAALLSEVSGRPVEAVAVDDEAFIQGLTSAGLPEPAARTFASYGRAIREGYSIRLPTRSRTLPVAHRDRCGRCSKPTAANCCGRDQNKPTRRPHRTVAPPKLPATLPAPLRLGRASPNLSDPDGSLAFYTRKPL